MGRGSDPTFARSLLSGRRRPWARSGGPVPGLGRTEEILTAQPSWRAARAGEAPTNMLLFSSDLRELSGGSSWVFSSPAEKQPAGGTHAVYRVHPPADIARGDAEKHSVTITMPSVPPARVRDSASALISIEGSEHRFTWPEALLECLRLVGADEVLEEAEARVG